MEVWQAYLPTRQSDTMDIITNTLGTWVGVMLYRFLAARLSSRSDTGIQTERRAVLTQKLAGCRKAGGKRGGNRSRTKQRALPRREGPNAFFARIYELRVVVGRVSLTEPPAFQRARRRTRKNATTRTSRSRVEPDSGRRLGRHDQRILASKCAKLVGRDWRVNPGQVGEV